MNAQVGVSLAVHNSRDLTRECLAALMRSTGVEIYPVVIDDGSNDGTSEMLASEYPGVRVLRGDGNLWWTRATNWGIRVSLEVGCDQVLLLNPDVRVEPDTVAHLARASHTHADAIVAPLVLDCDDPTRIWEAGHSWQPAWKAFPVVWINRYQYKRGTPVSHLPPAIYPTVSVIGRGGLMPRAAFESLGLFDEVHLPQYGADADMTLRAWRKGWPMYIEPKARVVLNTRQTGMRSSPSWRKALEGYGRYLTSRKHGEALRVLWYWSTNNLPLYQALPTYLFMLALNTLRYWQRFLQERRELASGV